MDSMAKEEMYGVKPSCATVAFASVSSDSTLRTIAFDSSARHGTETYVPAGQRLPRLMKMIVVGFWSYQSLRNHSQVKFQELAKSKGANETLGKVSIRAMPMCKGYSHYLESKPNNFCAPIREPKFGKFGG